MSEAVIITTNPLQGDRIAGSVGFPLPGGRAAHWRRRWSRRHPDPWPHARLLADVPEKTAEEFTADGFFITGDVGRVDADGRVWISGRAKDLIISGGYNVYPKGVELILDELPGITESAVIGLPHPDFEGVAAICTGQGDETAIIAAARQELAAYKAPA